MWPLHQLPDFRDQHLQLCYQRGEIQLAKSRAWLGVTVRHPFAGRVEAIQLSGDVQTQNPRLVQGPCNRDLVPVTALP